MAVLKQGSRGVDVSRLQLLLNGALQPNPYLRMDGNFGTQTHAAVVRFQRSKGLTSDGIVGPRTWAALGQQPGAPWRPGSCGAGGARWMDIAMAELGVHENSLPGQHSRRIVEYHTATSLRASTDEVPWCSSFVNWVMRQAGYRGTNSALARSWLEWGFALTAPRPGAITVIRRKGASRDCSTGSSTGFHVAFYVGSGPAHVRLLGGNQGDQVRYSNFTLGSYEVRGYRWPS